MRIKFPLYFQRTYCDIILIERALFGLGLKKLNSTKCRRFDLLKIFFRYGTTLKNGRRRQYNKPTKEIYIIIYIIIFISLKTFRIL